MPNSEPIPLFVRFLVALLRPHRSPEAHAAFPTLATAVSLALPPRAVLPALLRLRAHLLSRPSHQRRVTRRMALLHNPLMLSTHHEEPRIHLKQNP